MRSKPQRWYTVEGATVYVYDEPTPERSQSCSIVTVDDLPYYRRNFELSKVWAKENS